MPTTKTSVCTLEKAEELARTGGARKFFFRFKLVPAEKVGQPDEGRVAERASIEVRISDTLIETSLYGDNDVEGVAYWCAVEDGIKAGKPNAALVYDTYSGSARHPCNRTTITYPPAGPFEIQVESKIGF